MSGPPVSVDGTPPGRPLHNDDWGFDSNCYVCEPTNDGGLRIPFVADDEAGMVRARFALDDTYSGAPTFVHGGLTSAVLDEAQAWATIAFGGSFAVTVETTVRFTAPVMVGQPHEVRAWVTGPGERKIRTTGEVRDGDGTVCASAESLFVVLSEATATTAIGEHLSDEHRGFVRDAGSDPA